MNNFIEEFKDFFLIINQINSYNIDKKFPSMKRTIERFNFDEIYDEVLNYIEACDDSLTLLDQYLKSVNSDGINVIYRVKSEESLLLKWNKNIGRSKQLREVCNDIIGIRIITKDKQGILIKSLIDFIEKTEYNIDIIDFHKTPKNPDDGYRGVHLYFRNNPKGFPLEIQVWNHSDALLNFYTHEVLYKKFIKSNMNDYGLKLREWIQNMPDIPEEVEISFIEYLYEIVYSQIGGE